MKSKVSRLAFMNIGPFTLTIRNSEYMNDGTLCVDIGESINGEAFGFQIWAQQIDDDPRCADCYRHTWKLVHTSTPGEIRRDEEAARHTAVLTVVERRLTSIDNRS